MNSSLISGMQYHTLLEDHDLNDIYFQYFSPLIIVLHYVQAFSSHLNKSQQQARPHCASILSTSIHDFATHPGHGNALNCSVTSLMKKYNDMVSLQ